MEFSIGVFNHIRYKIGLRRGQNGKKTAVNEKNSQNFDFWYFSSKNDER